MKNNKALINATDIIYFSDKKKVNPKEINQDNILIDIINGGYLFSKEGKRHSKR